MKQKLILFAVLILSISLSAQVKQATATNHFVDHLRFGGSLGLTVGGGATSIEIAPQVGYAINSYVVVGISPEYIYNDFDSYSQHVYGIGGFARGEYAKLYVNTIYKYDKVNTSNNSNSNSYGVNSLWLGGGLRQHMGKNTWIYIGGNYNVLYNKKTSIYGSAFIPTISVSIGI